MPIGIDSVTGTERFTLGVPQLFDGISIVTVTVAILALGEVFFIASRARRENQDLKTRSAGRLWLKLAEFREAFPFFKGPFKDSGYAIQRTRPGEHYHWHIDGGSHEFSQRQLVAVWYLNDVPGPGGETEFSYQNVMIRPEAGKLLLFPPFWTHEHRGVTLQQGVKYIATTWAVFA